MAKRAAVGLDIDLGRARASARKAGDILEENLSGAARKSGKALEGALGKKGAGAIGQQGGMAFAAAFGGAIGAGLTGIGAALMKGGPGAAISKIGDGVEGRGRRVAGVSAIIRRDAGRTVRYINNEYSLLRKELNTAVEAYESLLEVMYAPPDMDFDNARAEILKGLDLDFDNLDLIREALEDVDQAQRFIDDALDSAEMLNDEFSRTKNIFKVSFKNGYEEFDGMVKRIKGRLKGLVGFVPGIFSKIKRKAFPDDGFLAGIFGSQGKVAKFFAKYRYPSSGSMQRASSSICSFV